MIQRLLLPLAVLAFSLPAFAQVSLPTFSAKPPRIRHRMTDKKVDYRVQIAPGVANPGEATTIRLSIDNVLDSHDARFGTRQPINDAKLTAYLVAPRTKTHRAWSATRTFLNVRDAGTYTVVFTSPVEGVHNLIIKGTSESAGPLEYSFPVAFGTWPIEKDVKLPELPRRLPKAELSDMDFGKALCEKHCLKTLAFALPKGATPTFLDSSVVAGMANTDLLTNLVGKTKIRSLTQTDQHHLLYYVHTLHNGIRDFFPKANNYLAQEFTINEHGLDRLDETARLQLSDKEATAMVLVAFKGGEATAHAELIPYDDRTARDALQISDKIGYVVFLSGKDGKLYELGFGLNLEPTYSISQIIARSQDGTTDATTAKALRSFRGLGRFNDARSLRRGSKTLQSQLLSLYLIAAELGTMYYADEREFTAFDSEFADLD